MMVGDGSRIAIASVPTTLPCQKLVHSQHARYLLGKISTILILIFEFFIGFYNFHSFIIIQFSIQPPSSIKTSYVLQQSAEALRTR